MPWTTDQLHALLEEHSPIQPYNHQTIGTEALVRHSVFALFDEMGSGKSKQTIDAAQILYLQKVIDQVIVIAPASVRSVWFDPELGELAKHLWARVPNNVTLYHARNRSWANLTDPSRAPLQWIITNYEFIRSQERRNEILRRCTMRTLLVLDESSAVKNHRADQTKAVIQIRRRCGRVVLLNGTPIANSPLDMFAQGLVMDPDILGCPSYLYFRSKYAVLKPGASYAQIIGWQNLEDMTRRFAPHVIRRLKQDCIDLPPKLPPIILDVTLSETEWKIYKEMRDQMITWLADNAVSTSAQAAVKTLRLAQITSGFLGGVVEHDMESENLDPLVVPIAPAFLETSLFGPNDGSIKGNLGPSNRLDIVKPIEEIGRSKLDALLTFLEQSFTADPNDKILVWSCFRHEVSRIERTLLGDTHWLKLNVGILMGGQRKDDRERTRRLLDPRTAPPGPVVVAGTVQTGAMGQNFTAAHNVIDLSYPWSLFIHQQSRDRVHRPGQVYPVSYTYLRAVGPRGQKTIDHQILKALETKQDVARWTTEAWRSMLKEE